MLSICNHLRKCLRKFAEVLRKYPPLKPPYARTRPREAGYALEID